MIAAFVIGYLMGHREGQRRAIRRIRDAWVEGVIHGITGRADPARVRHGITGKRLWQAQQRRRTA